MDDVISVFLLDDHEMSRRVVGDMLAVQPDMQLVGTSSGQLGAVGRVHVLDPDVAVLDVRLEEGNGVEACREIRSVNPRTACLLLTGMDDDEALFLAVLAGAAGYVLKRDPPGTLVDAVRRVAAGERLLGPAATTSALERIRSGPTQDEGVADLSDQERQVLDLLAEGLTNREIADRLFVAERTIKRDVAAILGRLEMAGPHAAALSPGHEH